MESYMKKLLFATVFASTALASSMGCNTDTLTGLHFGLGVSVLFDKYEADVDVATLSNDDTKAISYVDIVTAAASTSDLNTTAEVKNLATFWGNPTTTDVTDGTTTIFSGTEGKALTHLNTAYVRRNTFKKRTTNCGGEVKLAYFHDFGNHLMVGVDLTGIIASKNKKTVKIEPTAIANAVTGTGLRVLYDDRSIIEDKAFTEAGKSLINETGIGGTEKRIAANTPLRIDNLLAVKAANPGYTIMTEAQLNDLQENYALKTTSGENGAGELTFEKSVFNPRLAFIVGGTIYGWFAGLRMGMSYTTGKVYATGAGQDKMSKTVSISSPLLGLHLMKQMKIAGNNDAHLYLTADWNIGDGHRKVDINGVKSFKQTSYNISAGLTWRFKLGN